MKGDILSSGRSNDSRSGRDRSHKSITSFKPSGAVDTTAVVTPLRYREPLPLVDEPTTPEPADQLSSSHIEIQSPPPLTDSSAEYQLNLKQKDELIAALIHELEKAVEQLDRFQRSGADRSHSGNSAASGSPLSELAESRSPFMDDLRHMVEDWEQNQPASLLVRMESQLAAMHDMLLNLQRDDRPRAELGSPEDRIRQLYRAAEPESDADEVNMTLEESSPSWDAIKNQIFAAEPTSPVAHNTAEDSEILKLMAETPTPRDVSFSEADIDELKKAVVERDSYIIQLNRLFRTRNTLSLPDDWAALANVPAEMQIRIESLIEHLDVQVRLGEVEMSLERARLARERSFIQSEREMIEKHMKRLGLTSLSELDNISAATGNASDRRWMRFLGPNTK